MLTVHLVNQGQQTLHYTESTVTYNNFTSPNPYAFGQSSTSALAGALGENPVPGPSRNPGDGYVNMQNQYRVGTQGTNSFSNQQTKPNVPNVVFSERNNSQIRSSTRHNTDPSPMVIEVDSSYLNELERIPLDKARQTAQSYIQEVNHGDGLIVEEIREQNQQGKNEQQKPVVPLTAFSQNQAPVVQSQQVVSDSLGPSFPKADESVPPKTTISEVQKQSAPERPRDAVPTNNAGPLNRSQNLQPSLPLPKTSQDVRLNAPQTTQKVQNTTAVSQPGAVAMPLTPLTTALNQMYASTAPGVAPYYLNYTIPSVSICISSLFKH